VVVAVSAVAVGECRGLLWTVWSWPPHINTRPVFSYVSFDPLLFCSWYVVLK